MACALLFIQIDNALAQQRPQYSQYFTNPILLNPAVAGTADGLDARIGMRLQWVGFTDAPRSYYATVQTRLGASKQRFYAKTQQEPRYYHGFSGQVLSDVTGPTSRTSAYGGYAFNQALTRSVRLALGAMIGIQQFSLSGDNLRYSNAGAASISSFSKAFPDAGVGLWMYGRSFFLGGSVLQLFRNSFNVNDGQLGIYTAQRHGFVTGGLNLHPSKDWSLTPSFLVKIVPPAPVMVDINLKARYKQDFWAGVSYRHKDAVVVAAGLYLGQAFDFAYSYDIIVSDLARFQRGSHEITLGYRVAAAHKAPNPPDFWR